MRPARQEYLLHLDMRGGAYRFHCASSIEISVVGHVESHSILILLLFSFSFFSSHSQVFATDSH